MRSLGVFVALASLFSVSAAKDEFQAGNFVKQHLNSIGTEQARAAVKNRAAEGTVSFEIVNRGSEHQDGAQILFSESNKLSSSLKLPNPGYPGERFVSDGTKTFIAQVSPGVYSKLGEFVLTHNEILTEGLWGGTLSTAWALAHIDELLPKLEDRGLKKVDGRDLHRVDYVPRKRSDLQIELYFEPDTFRHVMSVYSLTISPGIGHTDVRTAGRQDMHYRLEERFADYKRVDGLMLPERWTIQFSINSVSQFEVRETSISHNVALDPRNFELK
jgi:hypothetical protein